ncbi:MAG: serine dehydratase subunit alpha family protein [Lachnospiraceae bacterium]|nr:serine dehydratase subunit alpha family protein [Lachnospiraceae bacterium]
MTKDLSTVFTGILKEELIPAMGCTEPIALAYAAAYARQLLGRMPTQVEVLCSGNIIKNTMAVTVPQTGGLRGIKAAVLAGIIGGDADRCLEVLDTVREEDIPKIHEALGENYVTVKPMDTTHTLHIVIRMSEGSDTVSAEIIDAHTNIGKVEKNGRVIRERKEQAAVVSRAERQMLNIRDILDYAGQVNTEEISDVLERQISFNTAISEEGLRGNWGACVGKTLLEKHGGNDIYEICKASAAAGSDARMNGCTMPVVINSGSGNQGVTVSLPVIRYAESIGATREELLRALAAANLCAIHQKTKIGRLSAYCGAVSAAVGAITGIAILDKSGFDIISQTIVNTLGTIGGIPCDGAKSSCAAKIASSLDCAFTAYEMAKESRGFSAGEGIVKEDVEKTIATIGRMAAEGMVGTDREILQIMVGQ